MARAFLWWVFVLGVEIILGALAGIGGLDETFIFKGLMAVLWLAEAVLLVWFVIELVAWAVPIMSGVA